MLAAHVFVLLGIKKTATLCDDLTSLQHKIGPKCEICFLPSPTLHGTEEILEVTSKAVHIHSQGLFVPNTGISQSKLSYVDIVQRRLYADREEGGSETGQYGVRKVSSTSTVSTQPEDRDETVDAAETFGRLYWDQGEQNHRSLYFPPAGPERPSIGKEGDEEGATRKKGELAKKRSYGLRALVPCPTEEPDRSFHLCHETVLMNQDY